MEHAPHTEALADEFAVLGKEVAAALDLLDPERPGWTHRRDVSAYGMVSLVHPAGWQLRIWRDKGYRPGTAGRRLSIVGVMPHEYQGPEEVLTVVAGTRPPLAIARHIARRLLPDYRAAVAEAVEHHAREQAALRARKAVFARLSGALPALTTNMSWEEEGYGLFYRQETPDGPRAHASGEVRLAHDGTRGSITANDVPLELLLEILALLDADRT